MATLAKEWPTNSSPPKNLKKMYFGFSTICLQWGFGKEWPCGGGGGVCLFCN
jgi:hypothetical protein